MSQDLGTSTPKTRKQLYQKQYRHANKEKLRLFNKYYQRDYFKKYPDRYLYWSIKGRATRKDLPFDLSFEDVVAPKYCPILGIELKRNQGGKSNSWDSPSVDRIIPELGYVKNNIQIISMRANLMKNDASVEELQRFADWITKTFPR